MTAMERPSIDLSGKVAVVTGGGAGIGRGVATVLARCGADVVALDIDPSLAERTARLVEEHGVRGAAVACDVMDIDQIRSAMSLVDRDFGRIDILVNNAGGVSRKAFIDQSERSWRRHVDINLISVFAATSAAVPVMIRQGEGGSIVNVTSIEATRAAPMYAVYAACKAAVASFTRSMALELAEYGIRVNAIAPDATDTPGNRGLAGSVPDELPPLGQEDKSRIAGYVPIGREGDVDECGELVAFLCSSMASYITGVSVPVDGGTWAAGGWVRNAQGNWTLFGDRA
ncbi:MAG TPA: SDR family oxidoreductase [Acidimicrobiales bacterium]